MHNAGISVGRSPLPVLFPLARLEIVAGAGITSFWVRRL
jgi:hypothetical protein